MRGKGAESKGGESPTVWPFYTRGIQKSNIKDRNICNNFVK